MGHRMCFEARFPSPRLTSVWKAPGLRAGGRGFDSRGWCVEEAGAAPSRQVSRTIPRRWGGQERTADSGVDFLPGGSAGFHLRLAFLFSRTQRLPAGVRPGPDA
jgi:hypothetical protein